MIIESLKNLSVAIDTLQGLPGNPRKGDVDAVAESLKRFGQRKPIVARKDDGTIIAGNHTWQAAKKLGWKEIAVAYVGDDDTTAQAYALADNRTAELGSYDEQALKDLIDKVAAVDPDLVRTAGWSDDAVKELVDKIESELPKELNEDVVPEVPVEAKTKLGDIYQLGKHRLMCGDSTDEKTVLRLMDGLKVDMVFTDPPYGINHSGKGITANGVEGNDFGEILGDGDVSVAIKSFKLCEKFYSESRLIFWGANYYPSALPNGHGWLVWDKERTGNTFSGAELAFVNSGVRLDVFRHMWHGMVKASEHGQKRIHPTQKPIALPVWCFNNYGNPQTILDLFGGSGSTIIAAEQTNRTCYMMELDPKYCDVIIQRWENFTGEKAVLVNAKSA
jgi:site-specific DNA-methyltransferase (adenine-specific)